MTRDHLSSLAHDLKTPIAVIRGYAELLASRDDDETREEAAVQILEAVRRLSELLDERLPELANGAGLDASRGGRATAVRGAAREERLLGR